MKLRCCLTPKREKSEHNVTTWPSNLLYDYLRHGTHFGMHLITGVIRARSLMRALFTVEGGDGGGGLHYYYIQIHYS